MFNRNTALTRFVGLLAAGLLGHASLASADVRYTVTDLGALVAGGDSRAWGVNEQSQVVGQAGSYAFVWENGNIAKIPPGRASWAFGINDIGQIVGERYGGWTQAVLWENGQMVALGTLGGLAASARAINNAGQITGWADNASGSDRAFLFANGAMADLGTLGGPQSWAFGINSLGQVVGAADTDIVPPGNLPISRAFVYADGAMVPIAGDYSEARDINDVGQVVGSDEVGGFLWSQGALINLPSLAEALALNDAGQVVGWGGTIDETDALLWESGITHNLNNLIPAGSGWRQLQQATDINDAEQIVGWGVLETGEAHGFLLTPVPEAGTFAALGAGGMGALRRTHRTRLLKGGVDHG
jgi:probable HAF family extracellular repeat protein